MKIQELLKKISEKLDILILISISNFIENQFMVKPLRKFKKMLIKLKIPNKKQVMKRINEKIKERELEWKKCFVLIDTIKSKSK